MAVVISKGPTTLNTPSGFYRVEAHNLGCFNATSLPLTTTRYIPLTFANAGNCLGVVLELITTYMISRQVVVTLQENVGGSWQDVPGATVTLNTADIAGNNLTTGAFANRGQYTVPFIIGTPKAVDTSPNKWRWKVAHGTGTGTWNLRTSDGTNPFHATWCDNVVNFNDDDVLIVKDKVIIDKTTSFGAVLGIGDTINGVACIICSNTAAPEVDTVCLLEWENPPAAAYTLTVKGSIVLGGFGGIRIGTANNRIPINKKATITFTTPAAGTAPSRFVIPTTSASSVYGARSSIFVYGEIPTYQFTTLKNDAATGQPNLVCNDSVNWANGDKVVVGKSYVKGQGDTTIYTVNSVNGNTITLTTNLVNYHRKAGGTVLKLNSHGVLIQNVSTYSYNPVFNIGNLVMSGVDLYNQMFSTLGTGYYYYHTYTKAGCLSQTSFTDCTFWTNSTSCTYLLTDLISPLGTLMQRCYGFRQNFASGCIAYYTAYHKSGRMEVKDSRIIGHYGGSISTAPNIRLTIQNCSFENGASTYFHALTGINGIFKNNSYWGSGASSTSGGAVFLYACVNPTEISGNKYNYNNCAFSISNAVNAKCVDKDSIFGSEYPNTIDIGIYGPGAFPDYIFKSPTGNLTFDETYLPDMVVGGRYGFTDYNDVANDDRMVYTFGKIQRDLTTVHTAGGSSLRFEPLSGSERFEFSFDVPTGNIQNKTMTVAIWCKINSAGYYSGSSYEMPRLNVVYDGSTTIYSEAKKTTDWQLLSVTFTPTTTSGKISVILSGMTDATGSGRYFYWDDMSILYPAGYKLDLGSFDVWDNALPVLPPIATVLSANDVWTVATSTLTGEGTIGKKIAGLKNPFLLINGEVII